MADKQRHIFTSESVTEGHPDKIADQISDAVLDAVFAQDPTGRVACETLVTTGICIVAGEITTNCYVDVPKVVRETIKDIGYTDAAYGFDCDTCGVLTAIQTPVARHRHGRGHRRRRRPGPDVRLRLRRDAGTDAAADHAGAQAGAAAVARCGAQGVLDYLRPDGKSQVTVEYDGRQAGAHRHGGDLHPAQRQGFHRDSCGPRSRSTSSTRCIPPDMVDAGTKYHINPTGRFVIGGPHGDTGLTGRKIIVDTYGGMGRHGGGAFSGKDPTKVDRSACYMARYIAKNIVAAGLAAPLRGAAGLRHRRGRAGVGDGQHLRHRARSQTSKLVELVRAHFPLTPAGHHRAPEAAPARSTARPPPSAISAAPKTRSPGKPRTRPRRCARPPAWPQPWRGRPPAHGAAATQRRLCSSFMATDTTDPKLRCDIKDLALADKGKRRIEWAFQVDAGVADHPQAVHQDAAAGRDPHLAPACT